MTEASLHRTIAFAGVGAAKPSGLRSALDLAVEAGRAALADAGLKPAREPGIQT